jgi:hypothetical protein
MVAARMCQGNRDIGFFLNRESSEFTHQDYASRVAHDSAAQSLGLKISMGNDRTGIRGCTIRRRIRRRRVARRPIQLVSQSGGGEHEKQNRQREHNQTD